MKISKTTSLTALHTFGVEANADTIVHVYGINDVLVTLTTLAPPYLILGGGSNIIPVGDIHTPILKNEIKGFAIIDEDARQCMVKVGGGEQWHHFVMWSVYHGLGGIENLALIPGTVGAAPIQNIGAYGVEQVDCFHSLTAIDLESGTTKTFYRDDCKFGYRDSIFKGWAKDQYFIADVTYLLTKEGEPKIEYADIQNKMAEKNILKPTRRQVAEMVSEVRTFKLPNPDQIGNAGSFFKNPIIPLSQRDDLLTKYPNLVHYPVDNTMAKLSAAWLIDQCGFKGIVHGHTGTYRNQALVLVNNGGATGKEVLDFALLIQEAVFEAYGVEIEPEVNVWG